MDMDVFFSRDVGRCRWTGKQVLLLVGKNGKKPFQLAHER
jgi:hypothetical protein